MAGYLAVLGGNKLACKAIAQLEKNGFRVLVLDKKPVEETYQIASKVLCVDFSDTDATRKALHGIEVSGIMAINDFGVVTAATIAGERKLFGYSVEAARNASEKTRMKDCWKASGLPTAAYKNYTADRIAEIPGSWDIFPCIIKPSAVGGGSRGVYYTDNKRELAAKLKELHALYPVQNIVVEEFIEGTEHTIEVLVYGGQTQLMSISDKKNYPGNKTIVQDLWFPGPKGNLYRKRLETLLHDACMSLGLGYGSAHFEVMITPADEIVLIEVGGRPGGGLNFHPISLLTTGYDYTLELASILTRGEPANKRSADTVKLVWHFFDPFEGTVQEVRGFENIQRLPEVVECDLMVTVGRTMKKTFSNDLERAGHYLFTYTNPDDVAAYIEKNDKLVEFVLEDTAQDHGGPSCPQGAE